MDRLNQLRGEAGGSRDSTLDTSSPPSEAYITANESSSKYFTLSEVDSTFDITPIKDVSLASTSVESEGTITGPDQLISNLSPIGKKNDLLDSYKIGNQIEAANILSGGVDIFDDNDNSYDGDELIIDDNVDLDDKSNSELKMSETVQFKSEDDNLATNIMSMETATASKDTEVVLQIDGKNVDAIDIGNGLYLYRKEGEEELAAVQIIDDDQHQPSFKFLKVRENLEGNLEVYEEIQIEVPKEVPTKEGKSTDKNMSHVPIKDINKMISDPISNKVSVKKHKSPQSEVSVTLSNELKTDLNKDVPEMKPEINFNGKMKMNEARKSPVIGSFTPMTYHSTPNKEGIPLTKTMVDLQLHPSRHSDNIKKTIEVHTDSSKHRSVDSQNKTKDLMMNDDTKSLDSPIKERRPPQEEITSSESQTEKGVIESKEEHKEAEKKPNICLEATKISNKIIESVDESINLQIRDKKSEVGNQSALQNVNKSTNVDNVSQNKFDHNIESEKDKKTNDSMPTVSLNPKNKLSDNKACEKGKIVNNLPVNLKDLNLSKIKSIEKDIRTTTDTKIEQDNSKKVLDLNIVCVKNAVQDTVEMSGEKGSEINNDVPSNKDANFGSDNNKVPDNEQEVEIIKNKKLDTTNATVNKSILVKENILQVGEKSDILSTVDKDKHSPTTEIIPVKSDPVTKTIDKPNTNISNAKLKEEIEEAKIMEVSKSESTNNVNPVKSEINHSKSIPYSTPVTETKLNTGAIKETVKQDNACANDKKNFIQETVQLTNTNETKTEPSTENHAENLTNELVESTSNITENKIEADKTEPENNNHGAVPFGQWTEVNRQDFLNRIKESKVAPSTSNGQQIKNSHDLNRRDILTKIDKQRQTSATAKAQEIANNARLALKKETPIFASKASVSVESKVPVKAETQTIINTIPTQPEIVPKPATESQAIEVTTTSTATVSSKKETMQRKEINNQDLIDKTIEGIINRSVPVKTAQEDTNQNVVKESKEVSKPLHGQPKGESTTLDDIEMQMNRLHGIPFVERPPHELPQISAKHQFKTYSKVENDKLLVNKVSKLPNLIPFVNKNQQKNAKENIDVDSEEEIIEHEPITGDIDINNKNLSHKPSNVKIPIANTVAKPSADVTKKEAIGIITEKDFDKFARRNSITYENCLQVNFDGSEVHNVIQTVVERENVNTGIKHKPRTDSKPPSKQEPFNLTVKMPPKSNITSISQDVSSKNYQHSSRVKMAYQSVMTAKRQLERPITIIEEKPVKVVYIDSNTDYIPSNLNVQGKDLVPIKKHTPDIAAATISSCDSLDSEMLDSNEDNKSQDGIKTKIKHQRKQVLTPVETPELELIEPQELGFDVSPKKKRKPDDNKTEKNAKALVPKKSYLLGRNTNADDKVTKAFDLPRNTFKETHNVLEPVSTHNDAASAIDSLVKAAALIETQSENIIKHVLTPDPDTEPITPIKRGRGRPRKYPLPEGENYDKNKLTSPQKKPRLIDAKVVKSDDDSEEYDSDDEIVKENWTMGKINENIVCPICSKLFRSENVVFKHVKHCTGPSPSRSDSDKRSPVRGRSQESDTRDKLDDMVIENINVEKPSLKKRKSKDHSPKYAVEKDDVIVIEDTPIKEKSEKRENRPHDLKKSTKIKAPDKPTSLVCEFCGKTFRQLSYLVSHKLQHGKEESKKAESVTQTISKSVFSCDVCKKEFRKLHHLVQHRIIHNPSNMTGRISRKSSSEQRENKTEKDKTLKQNDDPSAGFRCEPCDKSFRKLHHLVEHRETHDGINRQKNTPTTQITVEKPLPQTAPPPQCDVCKKTFRKLHHLIEHKEQHLETSSEKSDDKSVKSSLSTKDIIHECSLCYMVFPNEHSLTKHTIICQRKKRQSTTKQSKQTEDEEKAEDNVVPAKDIEIQKVDDNTEEKITEDKSGPLLDVPSIRKSTELETPMKPVVNSEITSQILDKPPPLTLETEKEATQKEPQKSASVEKEIKNKIENTPSKIINDSSETPAKKKKKEEKEIGKIHTTPKKKMLKEKIAPTVTKRKKSVNAPLPVVDEVKTNAESDDDEIRYMLNPDFKVEDTSESKIFMKVRAQKRNSLQIERPNSKDLVKRRISLQHPPKIPRLKPKPIEIKTLPSNLPLKPVSKAPKLDPVLSTDSDDSDVKYSFPKTNTEKNVKSASQDASPKDEKKTQRKSLAEKRKSLSAIAKRKSLGKVITAKHKVNTPAKPIKRRTADAEHRCDCGQLFSSAALLARHTSLAHTPPRIRRRRSPPPEIDTKTVTKPAPRKSSAAGKSRPSADSRKSSVRSEAGNSNKKPGKETRKSSVKSDAKPNDARKSLKTVDDTAKSASKTRRNAAHRGVPVPEKMRKLMEKNKK